MIITSLLIKLFWKNFNILLCFIENYCKSLGTFYEHVSQHQMHRELGLKQSSITLTVVIDFVLSLFKYVLNYHKDLLLQGYIHEYFIFTQQSSSLYKFRRSIDLYSHFYHYFHVSTNTLKSLTLSYHLEVTTRISKWYYNWQSVNRMSVKTRQSNYTLCCIHNL